MGQPSDEKTTDTQPTKSGSDQNVIGLHVPSTWDSQKFKKKESSFVNLPEILMDKINIKVYMRRWFMLLLFSAFAFSNAYQWISLSIVGNIIVDFYNASLPDDSYQAYTLIDMLSMISMISFFPLLIPALWFAKRYGLRLTLILCTLLNALGAGIKCFSVAPDRFPVLMVGQTICGLCRVWRISLFSSIAALWFGPKQVSTATSISIMAANGGIAVGFLLPPFIVQPGDEETMANGFEILHYTTAALTTTIFILVIVFFQNEPPKPPSKSQHMAQEEKGNQNFELNLFRNKQFMLVCSSYGINVGSFYAISVLLNTVILHYHEGKEQEAGEIGLTFVLVGVGGSVVVGYWLDRTKTFKETNVAICIVTLVSMVLFTVILTIDQIVAVFLTAAILGFCFVSYQPIAYEFAVEVTYPLSEFISGGVLSMGAELCGLIFIFSMRAMAESVSVVSANITICCFLAVGVLLSTFMRPQYKRLDAEKSGMPGD